MPSGGQQEGQGLGICPPKGMDGELRPLSSDAQRSSVSPPRTAQDSGGRVSHSWTKCPGALPAGQAGQKWGPNPDTAQTLRGEENAGQPLPETTSACTEGETKSVSSGRGQGPAASVPTSVQPLVFFFKCRFLVTEKFSLPLRRRRPGQQGPVGYVGQSKNPEKEEWMYSVE